MLPLNEQYFLYRFFRSVNSCVSRRMLPAAQPDEEHLTSTLCELLDERLESLHNMEYSHSALRRDLQGDRIANSARLVLETHQHSKKFEGRYSYSDLGLVVAHHDRVSGEKTTRAVLIQAKRLFSTDDRYDLSSRYESFDTDQLKRLTDLVYSYCDNSSGWHSWGSSSCAYYMFYTPEWSAFSEYVHDELAYYSAKRQKSPEWDDVSYDDTAFRKMALAVYAQDRDVLQDNTGALIVRAGELACRYCCRKGEDSPVRSFRGNDTIDDYQIHDKFRSHRPEFREIYSELRADLFENFIVFNILSGGGCACPQIVDIASGKPPNSERPWGTRHTLRIELTTPRITEEQH